MVRDVVRDAGPGLWRATGQGNEGPLKLLNGRSRMGAAFWSGVRDARARSLHTEVRERGKGLT